MDIQIRKISNGYVLKLNGKEIFCDVPEAICGETSAWVLEECRRRTGRPYDSSRSRTRSSYGVSSYTILES